MMVCCTETGECNDLMNSRQVEGREGGLFLQIMLVINTQAHSGP